jgi:hypothetical protein
VLRADQDVAQLARAGARPALVDGEREHVGGLRPAPVLAVQRRDPGGVHELDREVAVIHAGRTEGSAGGALQRRLAPDDVDLDQAFLRARRAGACFVEYSS